MIKTTNMKGLNVLQTAIKEIGETESPANSNCTKYGKWFGWDGQMWCGMFVSWCFAEAGFPLGNIGFKKGFAGCQTAYNYFVAKKQITTDPQPGDIVLLDWNNDKRFDHVGIFEKWTIKGKSFKTIEGNTSLNNNSNGGNVMRMDRHSWNNPVFVHPKVLE